LLKSSQLIALKVMDRLDRAVMVLASSGESTANRLLEAWNEVSRINLERDFARLPKSLRESLAELNASLTSAGSCQLTVAGMSSNQIEHLIRRLLNIYAESISNARKWSKEIEDRESFTKH
jgi:hypothetical protein